MSDLKKLSEYLKNLEAKPNKNEIDLKKIGELKAEIKTENERLGKEAKAKSDAKKKADEEARKEKPEDFVDYQKFAELKFLQWKDDRYEIKCLKQKTLEVFEKLEKKFKDYPGEKPKIDKTVFLAIGEPTVRIVKGYSVPNSLYKMFTGADNIEVDKYFEQK